VREGKKGEKRGEKYKEGQGRGRPSGFASPPSPGKIS